MGPSTWIDSYWRILLCIKHIRVKGESTLLTTRRRRRNPRLGRTIRTSPESIKSTLDSGVARSRSSSSKGRSPSPSYVLALKLGGKTTGVYLLIYHRTVYSRRRWITLPTYALEEWGISIDAKTDALKRLAQAGLIAVKRPKGRSLQAELLRKPQNWKPRKAT